MAAANARVLAFGASAGIIAGVSSAMSGLLASTIKVEKSLVEISTVLNKTGSELDKFGQDIFNVAKNTGKSFDEVAKGALELARQGLSAEDTLTRLNDALILSRLSGLDATQSVEGLTAAFNSFKKSGITTAEILNKVVAASQKYAVSEKDIIEGLKRSASVANLAGVSFEELAAVITAVQEKTARGGAVIGNAFKTIFSRIQDKAVLSDLQDMGVGVTDLQGEVLPALKILESLAKKMEGFSQIEQADIAKKLGGVYQLDKLLAALSDLSDEASVTTGALNAMEKAGSSAYQKNAVLNQTLAALLNKVAVSAEQLGAKLGEIGVTDSLKNVLGFFNSLLEGIQKILGQESGLGDLVRGLVKGLGSFLAGPGLALFGGIILKLSKDLVQFGFASLKAFFGIGKAAKEVQNVEGAISQILSKNVNLQQQLFALEGNRAGQLRLITGALVEQEAVLRRSANISSGLAAPLYNAGARAKSSGLRIGNSAGGYMPAVAKESKAIQKGVGGARAGDKPVVVPNFNFGGGKKGTMVAHTGEYIVPNFNGSGGSAVFNRQMVQSMGLPSGAKKIGAAGGFVPNFADKNAVKNQAAISEGKSFESILNEKLFGKSSYSPNAALDFPLPRGYGSNFEARRQLGIGDASIYGDAKRSFTRSSSISLVDKYLRTDEGEADFLSKKISDRGFINLKPNGLSVLYKYGELEGSKKINVGTKNASFSVAVKQLIEGKLRKTRNPNLSRTISMPLLADKVNAAGGFIPNFAPKFNAETVRKYADEIQKYKDPTKDFYQFPDGTGGYGSQIKNVLSRQQSKAVANKQIKEKKIEDRGFFNLSADSLGGILLVSPRFGKSQGSLDTSMQIGEIPFFNQDKSMSIDKNKYIKLSGIKTTNTPSGRDLKSLRADVNELFSDGIVRLANRLYGETFDPASGGEFSAKLQSLDASKKQQLLPPAAQGDLFEAAGKVALNSFANLESLFGSGEQNRPFDFQNPEALRKVFGVNAKRGEAKRGGEKNFGSSKQVQGIIKKIFNDSEYSSSAIKSLRGQGAFDFSKAQKAVQEKNAASGFIPNFYDYKLKKQGKDSKREILDKITGSYLTYSKNDDNLEIKTAFSYKRGAMLGLYNNLGKVAKKSGKSLFSPIIIPQRDRLKSFNENSSIDEILKALYPQLVYREKSNSKNTKLKLYLGGNSTDLSGKNIFQQVANYFKKTSPTSPKDLLSLIEDRKVSITSLVDTFANGYIPNFANPLQAALGREMAAGVPASQIYIDKSPSLKNAANPMGLMVANRRDEPAGGFQGISRARREGANPMTYGAAGGFVPNFLSAQTVTGVPSRPSLPPLSMNAQQTASSGAAQPMAALTTSTEEVVKANRDMLGTIFAVQAGMSVLTGATDGATSGIGKFANALSEGIGNFSTAAFAIQGVTSMGGAFGKFASKLGPYGLAIAGITATYSATAKYLDEVNGVNAAAAKNIAKMSDAAQNAAFNLDKLPQAAQKNIVGSAQRLVSGAATSSSYQYTGGGYGTQAAKIERIGKVDFEGSDLLTAGELEKSLISVSEAALGAGVSYDAMWNQIKDRSKDGKLTVAEVNELTTSFTKMMMTSDQLKESMRGLDLTPESVFSKSFGNISRDDLEKQLAGLTSGKKVEENTDIGRIQNAIFNSLTEEQQKSFDINSDAVKQQVTTVYNLLQDQKAAAKDAAAEAEKTFRVNMSMFKAEAAFEAKLNQNRNKIATEEVIKVRKIAAIENDATISQLEKQKRINIINNQYDTSIDKLNKQFEIVTNINNGLKESLGKASVQFGPEKIASVIPQLTESLKDFNPKEKDFAKKVSEELNRVGLNDINQTNFKELITSLSTILLTNQSITLEIDRQKKKAEDAVRVTNDSLDIKEGQLSLEKQIAAQIESRNSEASFAIENRVLHNAYEALSVNKEIERVKRDTAINELQKAEEVYKLELKRRDLESAGIGISLDQSLLDIDQELINKARAALTGPGKIASSGLSANLKIEDLQKIAETDFGAAEEIKVAIANAERQRDLAIRRSKQEQAGLSDVVPDDAINRAREGFSGGIGRGTIALQDQINKFESDLGEKIPQMFSDNMSSAINKMIEGGESFGAVLQGAAYEFVKGINQANIQNLSNKFSNFLFKSDGGAASGIESAASGIGSMLGFASGGKVSGGSGSKDDVPAMLMGGEYVVNKKAVSKYGPKFLEAINNGTLNGYAKGGKVQKGPQGNFYTPGTFGQGAIEGKRNLLDFATQTGTSGKFDQMINESGYQSIALEPESSRLSVSGMRNSPMFDATQSAKGQAFDLYLQQYNAEREAKKQAKEQKKALTTQLLMLVGGAALGGIGKAAMTGGSNAVKALGENAKFLDKTSAFFGGMYKGGDIGGGIMGGGLKNLFSGNFGLAYQSEILKALPVKEAGIFSATRANASIPRGAARTSAGVVFDAATSMSGGNLFPDGLFDPNMTPLEKNPEFLLLPPKPKPSGNATGGMIPSTSGIDTVPAMLSGGEFIMNRSAVQSIGAPNLQSMNSGGTSITSEETSKELNEKLLAKLDELIGASGSTGNITINVAPSGQTSQENSQDPSASRQQLARQIKDAVLQIINDEKRIGGTLRR
jgi:TP901 family phage tail tape measure protein